MKRIVKTATVAASTVALLMGAAGAASAIPPAPGNEYGNVIPFSINGLPTSLLTSPLNVASPTTPAAPVVAPVTPAVAPVAPAAPAAPVAPAAPLAPAAPAAAPPA